MQGHLCCDVLQGAHFEVCGSHPCFDGAVGMLDCHASDSQLRGIFV